jgi:hypothetical protein
MSSFRIFTPTCKNVINNSNYTTVTLILPQSLKNINTCSVFINVTVFGNSAEGLGILCERDQNIQKISDGLFSGSLIQTSFQKYIGTTPIKLNIPKLTKCNIAISIIDSAVDISTLLIFKEEVLKNNPSVDIYVKAFKIDGNNTQNQIKNISDADLIPYNEGNSIECDPPFTFKKVIIGHSSFSSQSTFQSLTQLLAGLNYLNYYPYRQTTI